MRYLFENATLPANIERWPDATLIFSQHLQHCTEIKMTLCQRSVLIYGDHIAVWRLVRRGYSYIVPLDTKGCILADTPFHIQGNELCAPQ